MYYNIFLIAQVGRMRYIMRQLYLPQESMPLPENQRQTDLVGVRRAAFDRLVHFALSTLDTYPSLTRPVPSNPGNPRDRFFERRLRVASVAIPKEYLEVRVAGGG